MKIQFTNVLEQDNNRALVEILISDSIEPDPASDYLEFRFSIESDPTPRLLELQLVALQSARDIIGAQIQAIQQKKGRLP